ncbi:hypothetical protein [Escherichia coli]|uniref:hypothetical protein n=1 Tax=Escherichia coli TaxID=562 RepID=UPI001FCCC2A7|nr:hypothetical protein [Escherichia coli]
MHYSDVVNIDKNKTVIGHILSQARKYILNRRTWRFFFIQFFMARSGGPFSYPRHARRTSHQITPHKRHLRVPLTGCFYGPLAALFYLWEEKACLNPYPVTSIPPDGVSEIDRWEVKSGFHKSVKDMDFISRRVAIDQGHKLASNVKYLLAVQSGAIALRWHSNWRRPGYKYRQDHKERDEKIYLLRNSWALEQGLIKPVYGFYDEITAAGEEVYCSCDALPIYAPQKLPDEFLTEKGKREFNRA